VFYFLVPISVQNGLRMSEFVPMTSQSRVVRFVIKVAFDVIMAVTVQSTVFWVVVLCKVERERDSCFRGTYSICLQGQSVNHAENQEKQVASWAGLLLCLLFHLLCCGLSEI
jgi:hypothetical protein